MAILLHLASLHAAAAAAWAQIRSDSLAGVKSDPATIGRAGDASESAFNETRELMEEEALDDDIVDALCRAEDACSNMQAALLVRWHSTCAALLAVETGEAGQR